MKTERQRPYPHFKFPDEIIIEVSKLDENSCQWHRLENGSYMFSCSNYGWFPSNVLMGVVNKRFADTFKIGANNGSNLGTATIGVLNKEKAIEMLKNAGYNINEIN